MLEKSKEPFEKVLAQAGKILNIQVNNDTRNYAGLFGTSSILSPFVPLDEWALKWLLKRLQEDASQHDSPCLSPRAWSLIQALITRMPIRATARLIRICNFTFILQKTLQYSQRDEASAKNLPVSPERGDSVPEDSPAISGSISGTVDNASARTISKKRKRGAKEPLEAPPSKQTILEAIPLLGSVSAVVKRLLDFTRDLPDRSRGYAVEHMKAALRLSAQNAAAILGRSLTIASLILNDSVCTVEAEKTAVCVLMDPIIDLWDLNSITYDGELSTASSVSFGSCPQMVLLLIQRISTLSRRNV